MATANAAARGTLIARPGASRKLLQAKALAAEGNSNALQPDEALEDSFLPVVAPDQSDREHNAHNTTPADKTLRPIHMAEVMAAPPETADSAPPAPVAPPPAPQPSSAPAWSMADKMSFQSLTARRRAAGYQRRGRDVGGQMLTVGGTAPNAGTVAAAIVALVAERGTLARGDLLTAMAADAFVHPRAKRGDRGWCQGYVAGLVRDGFLTIAAASEAGPSAGAAADQGAN